MTSLKTATSVLTELKNGRHTFLKFGLEAEQSYSAMLAGEERDNVCLYNKFKMKLHTDVSEQIPYHNKKKNILVL